MISTSDALVAVADSILEKITQLGPVEITKKGRKYKFVNNTFQRIQKEDKHLIIHPEDLNKNFAALLAHRILSSISPDMLTTHRDLSLMIIGVADQLEKNGWYEEENSSVINYKALKFVYIEEHAATAIEFAQSVTDEHLAMGYNILYCSKLNFFHTDHHIGTRLEGHHMRLYVEKFFGEDALELPEVLTALKSFVHWANIKGFLYKLDVDSIDVDETEKQKFSKLPDPPAELKDYVYARPPSGTSKYFLVRKAMNTILENPYSQLIPYPQDSEVPDPALIYRLCQEIQKDPVRYHLRAEVKRLARDPISLADLSQQHDKSVKVLLQIVSLVINTFTGIGCEFLLLNSKIPNLGDLWMEGHSEYYKQLLELHDKVAEYEDKGWTPLDIVNRLKQEGCQSMHERILDLRNKFPEDSRAET